MNFYFSKNFDHQFTLDKVTYYRCIECGFTQSETHCKMNEDELLKLNSQYHLDYLGSELNNDDPNWLSRLEEQSKVLNDASELGLISINEKWLDYGCGDGKLSDLLNKKYNLKLHKYDEYLMSNEDYLSKDELLPGKFDFVITTSVFEHLIQREEFDEIESLVSTNGVFALHTLVREDIPKDPSWFYLLPVHCSFHTNKSMDILFNQWGYKASVYNVDSRLWLWFKNITDDMIKSIERANERNNAPIYIFKNGFVDYWK